MEKCLFCFDYEISHDGEVVKSDGFCIDAHDYLAQHLECDEADLADAITKSSDEDLTSIAQWAASSCSYMHNILLETVSASEAVVAKDLAEKLAVEFPDEYDDIYDGVCDGMTHKVVSAELIIDNKTYKGR